MSVGRWKLNILKTLSNMWNDCSFKNDHYRVFDHSKEIKNLVYTLEMGVQNSVILLCHVLDEPVRLAEAYSLINL